MLTLVAGLVATTWQARRTQVARRTAEQQGAHAERRVADLRGLIDTFLFDVHDALVDIPGGTTTRKLVAAKAREYLDGLAENARGDLGLQEQSRLNGPSFTHLNGRGDRVISFVLPVDGGPAPIFSREGRRIGTMHGRRIDA